jgi:hypothetical protein
MKNIYEKYLSDNELMTRKISRCKLVNKLFLILWVGHLIYLTFFSDKINMSSNHELVTFVCITLAYIASAVQMEVLYLVDLIKKKLK